MTKSKKIATETEKPKVLCSSVDCAPPQANVAEFEVSGKPLCRFHGEQELQLALRAAARSSKGHGEEPAFRFWDADTRLSDLTARLAANMRSLAERMASCAERLESAATAPMAWQGRLGTSVNSLGEVQGRGLDIDRDCALLDVARKEYRAAARSYARSIAAMIGYREL